MKTSKKMVGTIVTSTSRIGFNVHGPRGEYIVATSESYGIIDTHVNHVRRVAKEYFGYGVLKAIQSTELPTEVTDAWGMTTREGSVSIKVTHYQVWQ
jgi:hypothetical protein